MELSIVVNDDAYDANEGKVVASAWVCVYALKDKRHVIEQFEPEKWSYGSYRGWLVRWSRAQSIRLYSL